MALTIEELEAKLIELESMLGFQDHTIEQLNDVIYKQQLAIEDLESKITLVTDMVKKQDGYETRTLEEEKPPHW